MSTKRSLIQKMLIDVAMNYLAIAHDYEAHNQPEKADEYRERAAKNFHIAKNYEKMEVN